MIRGYDVVKYLLKINNGAGNCYGNEGKIFQVIWKNISTWTDRNLSKYFIIFHEQKIFRSGGWRTSNWELEDLVWRISRRNERTKGELLFGISRDGFLQS